MQGKRLFNQLLQRSPPTEFTVFVRMLAAERGVKGFICRTRRCAVLDKGTTA